MVCKTVPFGALFWCPVAKGHRFCLSFPNGALLVGGTLPKGNCFGAFLLKKGTIFQNGSQRAVFWLRLFFSVRSIIAARSPFIGFFLPEAQFGTVPAIKVQSPHVMASTMTQSIVSFCGGICKV